MTYRTLPKSPFSPGNLPCPPRPSALERAVRRALSPARVAGGLLAVGLAGLATPALGLELADLDGSNGFALNGINIADFSGRSVSDVGDINGDGIDDFIIGADLADPGGRFEAGQSYVVFGTQAGLPAAVELSALDGTNGFALNGINAGDVSSVSVSGAGDINNDGIDDLIIGANGADPSGRTDAGQSYVVFGSQAAFPAVLELSTLDGTNGFALNGINNNDRSGRSVSGVGDVNGDGIDDILIGANGADPAGRNGAGQSYVVFGSQAAFAATLELSALDGTNGFALNGIQANDNSGRSVSGAGDVNGDGSADILIGADLADPGGRTNAGQSYVVFGRPAANPFPAALELADLDGDNGFALNGINNDDRSGWSVSGAGDVNGDGSADILIGAFGADPDGRLDAGQSYVVLGSQDSFAAALELSALDGTNGVAINGINNSDQSGFSVSSAGDVNGDGVDDILIGARLADPDGRFDAGQSYVVLGSQAAFPATLELSALDDTNGFAINGINNGDFSGRSVSGAGDVNGDGVDDILIGAYFADPNGRFEAGQSYVIFGEGAALGPLTTVGLYDPNQARFLLRTALAAGPADIQFPFGPASLGWQPLSGDWDGNDTTTVGLYDPVAGQFHLGNTLAGGPAATSFRFGPQGFEWRPVSGDWDGDGTTTVGLYNPVSGTFFLKNSHTPGPADMAFRFGPKDLGWRPVSGDWDGDGTTTVGLYDPVSGTFFLKNSHTPGPADTAFRFGPKDLGWLPLSGDWNGNGTTTVGLYKPDSSHFYLRNSPTAGSADISFRYGVGGSGWLPVTGDWEAQ